MAHRDWKIIGICFICCMAALPVVAADSAPSTLEGHDILAGKQAAQTEDWKSAIAAFSRAVANEPNNADALNYLAYSYRQSGDLDNAFKNYKEALRLDPKHRGAHEYIGEAYLKVSKLANAEEHLRILDNLCFLPCAEYSDLKQAVTDFKARQQK